MSILAAELKWYRSAVVTNTASNGGKLSINEVVGGVKNNIFPDVSQAERLAGLIRYRKVFAKLTNAANEVLVNPAFHLRDFTPADDRVEIFVGTQTDTEGDITGSEQMYGVGALSANVSAGATQIVVTIEDASQVIFEASGNTIHIGDDTNGEYHTNVDVISTSGDQITLELDAGAQLANAYTTANDTTVSSIIDAGLSELEPTIGTVVATSAGTGDYDSSGSNITGHNIGTVEDTLTLTFTSATAFDCTDAAMSALGSGNTSSDFSPVNTDFSVPYVTVLAAGWSGTWQAGDTLTIPTHPAAQGLWLKQTVPAGTVSFSGNNFVLRFGGESA